MTLKNLLFVCLIMSIIVLLINISVVFIKISDFRKELTGSASSNLGYVNITVNTAIIINISRDIISWGPGTIDAGEPNSTLYTEGDSTGIVERGNWSGTNAKAFVIENTGSVNASLLVSAGKNASSFFSSLSNSNQEYKWNMTNKETGSCIGGATLGQWQNVNTSGSGTKFCSQFDFDNGKDEVYLDILLTVPYDAGNIGVQSDTITIIGNVAG